MNFKLSMVDVVDCILPNAALEWQAKNLRWRSREVVVACPLEGCVGLHVLQDISLPKTDIQSLPPIKTWTVTSAF